MSIYQEAMRQLTAQQQPPQQPPPQQQQQPQQGNMVDPFANSNVNEAIGMMPEEQRAGLFKDYGGQMDSQKRALAQANSLRSGGGTKGNQAGNQFVAANPWSAVADVAKQGIGAYKANQAEDAMGKLGGDRAQAQRNLAEMLFKNKQASPTGVAL